MLLESNLELTQENLYAEGIELLDKKDYQEFDGFLVWLNEEGHTKVAEALDAAYSFRKGDL